jgi:hypothetical protein
VKPGPPCFRRRHNLFVDTKLRLVLFSAPLKARSCLLEGRNRHAVGVDTKDREPCLSCFTDEIEADVFLNRSAETIPRGKEPK